MASNDFAKEYSGVVVTVTLGAVFVVAVAALTWPENVEPFAWVAAGYALVQCLDVVAPNRRPRV